jgi:protocatechuate 3,4-dioxygenase beta subunit
VSVPRWARCPAVLGSALPANRGGVLTPHYVELPGHPYVALHGQERAGRKRGGRSWHDSPSSRESGRSSAPRPRWTHQYRAAAPGPSALGTGGLVARARDASTPSAGTATPPTCTLTPELTEGPYYVDDALIRADITEGKPGIPLKLRFAVQDPTACSPLANAAVNIWHCDAQGSYSGVNARPGSDATEAEIDAAAEAMFLRGDQITDEDGIVEFGTIYPGWYRGRTVHIHMNVIVNGEATTTYEGGHISHIGQLFFDEEPGNRVFDTGAYLGRPDAERTLNDEDVILGEITVGVDPTATSSGNGRSRWATSR